MQIKLPEIKGAAVMKGNRSNSRKKIYWKKLKSQKQNEGFVSEREGS
jgi:hypothetical protein